LASSKSADYARLLAYRELDGTLRLTDTAANTLADARTGKNGRLLAMPKTAQSWSLTSLREKLIKIGAKVVSHGR
jgi:hypothetical protein